MKGTIAQPLFMNSNEEDYEEQEEYDGVERDLCGEINGVVEKFQCMNLHKREGTTKKGSDLSWVHHALWKKKQKSLVARLERQLKARWQLEDLIDEQLNRYHAHYNHTMVPSSLNGVSSLLVPKWSSPNELAALGWLGDWRPSAILDLLRGLAHSSSSLPESTEQLLSHLVHEIRIEETVIDEEIAEIQSTCVLILPFSPINNKPSYAAAMSCLQNEFKKILKVISKAQQLRFKALELVVRKVLSQKHAAEFLVAFSGIQDAIHQVAEKQGSRRTPPTVPLKALMSK